MRTENALRGTFPMKSETVGAVIMASGLARRFGSNKLLADFGGEPMLCRVLRATEGISPRIVVTRSEDVHRLCVSLGVPVLLHTLPHRSDTVRLGLDALLREKNIGLIVLAGFMTVLPDSFCAKYENRIINVHPSLIPSFCGEGFYGLRVHEAALAKGVKVTGATVHFVSEVVDGGAIIAQKAVEVEPGDTPEVLQKRVMQQAEWILLPQAVSDFCAGRLSVNGAIVTRQE